jgi:hypothetical protein
MLPEAGIQRKYRVNPRKVVGRMDELVKLVSKKTGLPEDQARIAVQVVVDYLSKKLPPPTGDQIKAVLGSGGTSGFGDAAKGLGGLLGKK